MWLASLSAKVYNAQIITSSVSTHLFHDALEQKKHLLSTHVHKIAKSRLSAWSCLSIRLSVCMEQFGSHWLDFHEI
jgi:hypothetical protein